MSTTKLLASSLETFIALLAAFVAHRLLSMDVLSVTELNSTLRAEALVVGLLSDVWIACLSATLIGLLSLALSSLGMPQVALLVRLSILLLAAVALGAHQAYVDFYRFQMTPFHLRYLLDTDFILANGLSLLGLKPFLVFLSAVVTLAVLVIGDFLRDQSTKRLGLTAGAVVLAALLAHNRNIHYRVQWFVPETLQVNVVEGLYLQLKSSDLPEPLTPAEASRLAEALAKDWKKAEGDAASSSDALLDLLTQSSSFGSDRQGTAVSAVGQAIKARFADAAQAGRRPMILVVLLESLRPAETGYFAPDGRTSLTPRLDALARSGVTFLQAYSTGSVTRGAQEAAFCGYLGSRDTSLMRGRSIVRMGCLPELARATGAAAPEMFWLHGGEGRFDNQVAFWSARGVDHLLSLKDFPEDAPRTGWGVGDATFFAAAAERLEKLRATSSRPYLLGMALSVSNHIPWTLPVDLPAFKPPEGLEHQSYATTAYADAAFGLFLDELKRRGLWQDTLLVVASDHGNTVPPYVDLYGNSPLEGHLLQSHINLLIAGGLVDQGLVAAGEEPFTVDRVVSQADVAPLIGYVAGIDHARFMGENPLVVDRHLPVFATLEQDVFIPGLRRVHSRHDAARRIASTDPEEVKTLLYYRAFLQYANTQP